MSKLTLDISEVGLKIRKPDETVTEGMVVSNAKPLRKKEIWWFSIAFALQWQCTGWKLGKLVGCWCCSGAGWFF